MSVLVCWCKSLEIVLIRDRVWLSYIGVSSVDSSCSCDDNPLPSVNGYRSMAVIVQMRMALMKIAFAVAGEAKAEHENMLRVLSYSLRTRGGALCDAPIYITFNDRLNETVADDLRNHCGAVVESRPRLSRDMGFMNKYNSFFAPGLQDADWVVLLDCDVAVINDLAPLLEWAETTKADLGGVRVDSSQVWGLETVIHRRTGLPLETVQQWKQADDAYPYYNGGMIIFRGQYLETFRESVIAESHELFRSMRTGGLNPLHWLRIQWNRKMVNHTGSQRLIIPPFFAKCYADQVAIITTMVKLGMKCDTLPHQFNFRVPSMAPGIDEDGILILHYLKAYYPVDQRNLFNSSWIGDYVRSEHCGHRALGDLVRSYVRDQINTPRTESVSIA